ncbi:hypothetical protein L484_025880 [Morus notabilis]|uniref:Uncharacterized protein n=1 Tax=Morus notabilis TaxID=981085 RepID=W9RAT8_9ROSA|nr:hypothetical protein L484_025880 [Morus notabilis]
MIWCGGTSRWRDLLESRRLLAEDLCEGDHISSTISDLRWAKKEGLRVSRIVLDGGGLICVRDFPIAWVRRNQLRHVAVKVTATTSRLHIFGPNDVRKISQPNDV